MYGQNLKDLYEEKGAAETSRLLGESLKNGELQPERFSLRELAESFCGPEWARRLHPARTAQAVTLLEAGEAVDVTAFANITGQLLYSKILEGYRSPVFIGDRLVTVIPTRLDGEKIPGVSRMSDEIEEVRPGMPYPHAGFGEEYIETPSTTKRGLICSVTKEAVYFDRTNLVLRRAHEVGEVLGLNREKRILKVFAGATNNYKRNGTSSNTYLTSGSWVNVKATNTLQDWTDIEVAEQLFADMTDPTTGEPVLVTPNTLVTMPAYLYAARRVVNATEVRFTASGAESETLSANPIRSYDVLTSPLLYSIVKTDIETDATKAKKYWFVGEPKRAFAYMENWPITVVQAPANDEADFSQDIVLRVKASERGVAAVIEPRYMVRSYEN